MQLAFVLLAATAFVASANAGEIPDPALTPGVIASAKLDEVCESDGRGGSAYSRAHRMRFGTETERDRFRHVFRSYGVDPAQSHDYELDHLVPLCVGGADAVANLWPQPRRGTWNAREKDRLEGYVCRAVCNGGRLDLPAAQGWFLAPSDWRDAYRRVFGSP